MPVFGKPGSIFIALAAFAAAFAVPASPRADVLEIDEYWAGIESWRTERAQRLVSETGWLTVAGFSWLEAGDNPIGTAPDNKVVLPSGSGPAHAGVLRVEGEGDLRRVTFVAEPGVTASIGEEMVNERVLVPDQPGPPDRVSLGRITFWVLLRGGELGVRLRDPECPLREAFNGLSWFDIDSDYRVMGTYATFDEPREIQVPNFLGYVDTSQVYGMVEFELEGRTHSLIPINDEPGDDELFFVIGDGTNEIDTYGGGRFLVAERQDDGTVVMDFNRTYNPPCAYNPWTTCPQPSPENILSIAIRAGEKDYPQADQ